MKQKLLKLFVLGLLCVNVAFAQNRTITGRVTSSEDGKPIQGVSVRPIGQPGGGVTDQNGNYSIALSGSATAIEFTFVGYLTSRLPLGTSNVLNAVLAINTSEIGEVVVTGYGITQQKRDITGAVSSINSKQIEKTPIASFDRAMQGRLPGVRVTTNSGTPGSAVSVLIRGNGSFLASSAPLYIIDGIQVSSGSQTRLLATSNILSGLNADDIESIDVLKDASSASIYGAQAANGVIVITTKKGRSGKTALEFSTYFGHSEYANKLDVLNGPQWLGFYLEEYTNRFGANSAQTQSVRNIYGADPATAASYDWYDAIYRKGVTQNYQLSARGGDEKTKFYISAGIYDQKGQQINQDFSRKSFKTNLDHIVSDKFSTDLSLNLASFTQNGTSSGSTFANPAFAANFVIPTQPIYTPNGDYNEPLIGALSTNAIKSSTLDDMKGTTNQLQGLLGLNYKFLPELRLRVTGSLNYSMSIEDNYTDPRTQDGGSANGRYTSSNNELINVQGNATLSYNKLFGQVHRISGLTGFEYRNQTIQLKETSKTGFPSYLFRTLGAGSVLDRITSGYNEFKNLGYFARAEYSYDDKYIVNGTIRYDGNSRFGEKNKFGLFASGSLTWRVSGEDWLANTSWLSDWKIRTSYGKVGNSGIDDFVSRSLYAFNAGYNGIAGIQPFGLGNDNLTWEDSYTLNIGTDIAILKNRISITAEYYNKLNTNLLLNRALPRTSGYASVIDNAGKMRNRGFELAINSTNTTGKFRWSTNFNISMNKNKVLEYLSDDINPKMALVGNSFNRILAYKYAGVNPADGRPMWYDQYGNITYTVVSDDRYIIGNTQQKFFGGLTNTFSFDNFELSGFLQYATGFMIFDQNKAFIDSYGFASNRTTDVLRRWTSPGQITDVPKAYAGGTEPGGSAYNVISTKWNKPADYLRLKEVKLSYRMPSAIANKLKLSNLTIYAQGTNLLTWTKYDGIDPEVASTDNGAVPQARTYTLGLTVGF